MIFDIHCHILPGVDDGARNEASTKRMLQIAASEGVDVIVATPHFQLDRENVDEKELKRKCAQVRALWKKYGTDKELYLGNEVFYSEEVQEALEQGAAKTMNGTSYVLVEFPIYEDYPYIKRGVQKLRYAGYIPILAHVERYDLLKEPKKIQELIDLGACIQVNASTVLGKHGFWTKWALINLMKRGMVHFVATDAHDSKPRAPRIAECAKYMEKKLGIEKTQRILKENPEIMLRGEKLYG